MKLGVRTPMHANVHAKVHTITCCFYSGARLRTPKRAHARACVAPARTYTHACSRAYAHVFRVHSCALVKKQGFDVCTLACADVCTRALLFFAIPLRNQKGETTCAT